MGGNESKSQPQPRYNVVQETTVTYISREPQQEENKDDSDIVKFLQLMGGIIVLMILLKK